PPKRCPARPRSPPRSSGRPTRDTALRTPPCTCTAVPVSTSTHRPTGTSPRPSGPSSPSAPPRPSCACWAPNLPPPRHSKGGKVGAVSSKLQELLDRHVEAGTVPGAVAVLGSADAEVVTAGAVSIGGGPMPADAIMRIQSMTKAITAVAALRLVAAGRLDLDESV